MNITLTVEAATAATGLSRTRLYQLMAAGAIEHRKIGRRTMILTASLRRYIEAQPPARLNVAQPAKTAA
jgi:predicted DNA-binding transcriptional regulator AlpA